MAEADIAIGVCGSVTDPDPRLDPLTYCRTEEGRDFLHTLAISPGLATRKRRTILNDLLRVGAVRAWNGKAYLNFPLFLEKDQAVITRQAKRYGGELAAAIERKKTYFHELCRSLTYGAVPQKNLFILAGCACLDWRCLELFRERGLLAYGTNGLGENRYSLWGKERTHGALKALYWGSHNMDCGDHILTSFGDHAALPRKCLPDMFWALAGSQSGGIMAWRGTRAREALENRLRKWGGDIGRAMASGHARGNDVAFLEEIIYYRNGKPNIPVFLEQDKEVVRELKGEMDRIALNWATDNYSRLRRSLQGITPDQHGVPYAETFTQVWHYVFGHANRALAVRSVIFDTYGRNSDFRGFLPAVHEKALCL